MSISRLFSFTALALLTLSAQDQAGNQRFRIPEGWKRMDGKGVTFLRPSAEAQNSVLLFLAGHPLKGEFRETFDRDVKGMNGTARVVKSGQVESRHMPEGIDLLAMAVETQDANGVRFERYYMAASVQGRFEMLMYMAATPSLFKRYWPTVKQFVSSWSFADGRVSAGAPIEAASGEPTPEGDPTAPLAPPAPAAPAAGPDPAATPAPATASAPASTPPNRLEGIYSGYKYNYVTVLGVVQKKAVSDYFSFFPNGTVFWGLPQGGLAGFNAARACQGRVYLCGTYQMNGEQITIALDSGKFRQAGALAPGGLQIADRRYTLQGDISKSAAHGLEGDFGRADAQPGEDLARRFIRFTRDGRFADQGIVTTIVSSDISTGTPRFERPAGNGTYSLGPYSIILRYSDGYIRQLGVIVPPEDMDKPAFSKLLVNTYTLVRRR